MARYIDADKFEKYIRDYADKKCFNGETELANGILKTLSILKEQPTADVKEVVYCKGCKYRNTNECSMWIKCSECGSQWSWENNNDYCSYGEVR